VTNNGRRYAVVTVNNGDATSWWWYFNRTKAQVADRIDAHEARLIDIDPHANGTYNVVMVGNGRTGLGWWYYYRRTPQQIKDKLSDKGARLIDIEPDGNGTFTVIMVEHEGKYWWWYRNQSADQVAEHAAQLGARIVDIERYQVNGIPRYAVILLNNVNALTTQVREIMRPPMQGTAWGFYFKRVDGPVYAALQHRHVFEPASMIKVLHHLHAMTAIHYGSIEQDAKIRWYVRSGNDARYASDSGYDEDKNKCAYEDDGTPITSHDYVDNLGSVLLKQMMKYSDNRATDAVLNTFGRTNINVTADLLGMDDSHVYHRIGCPKEASPAGYHRNELTLFDAGLLYEAVAKGLVLGSGVDRNSFYGYMYSNTVGLKPIIDEEAADLGLSQATADSFRGATKVAVKGGTYTNGADCPAGVSGICWLLRRTGGGRIALPFKDGVGTIGLVEYVYGSFVDGTIQCGANCDGEETAIGDARTAGVNEMLRPQIRAALATWA
jgi:hypothetical protein